MLTAYFSHLLGDRNFCVRCGQMRWTIQANRRWVGNTVKPECMEAENVVGFRPKKEHASDA